MGKIYRALGRSGNVFEQEDFSKRALSENGQITSLEKIDSLLVDLGLGKNHISQQSIKELNKSLQRIDGCIVRPESFFSNDVICAFSLNALFEKPFWSKTLPDSLSALYIFPIIVFPRFVLNMLN